MTVDEKGRERVAEAIYEALGFSYADRMIDIHGKPIGVWRDALAAASAAILAYEAAKPPPALVEERAEPSQAVEAHNELLDQIAVKLRQAFMDCAHATRGLNGSASSRFFEAERLSTGIIESFKNHARTATLEKSNE